MKKLIDFNEDEIKMINDLKKKFGTRTDAQTIRTALVQMHTKAYPDYITVQKDRPSLSPQEKGERSAEQALAKDEAKKQKLIDSGQAVCDQLGGKVDKDGRCHYHIYTYFGEKRAPTKSPRSNNLPYITSVLLDHQYKSPFVPDLSRAQIKEKVDELIDKPDQYWEE